MLSIFYVLKWCGYISNKISELETERFCDQILALLKCAELKNINK